MTLGAIPRSLVRHPYRTAAGIALVVGLAGIFQHSLWTPDEPREAEIGREMLLSGWSSMPMLGGAPFLEKPPLHPWVMAFFYRLFGVSEGVARLPALCASLGAVLVAAALAQRLAGRSAAVAAAVVLATMVGFADVGHKAVNDALLICFVGAAHLFLLERRTLPLAGLCCGLAFLTKGPIGPILALGPPLVAGVVLREWRVLRAIPWCVFGTLLLGTPWVLALGLEHGWDKVRVCLVDNTLGRSLGGPDGKPTSFGHERGPFYYLGAFPLMLAPWILVLPAWLRSRGRKRALFLALLVLAGGLLLSIPSGKRELYLAPLLPAAAAVAGAFLVRTRSRATLSAIALVYALGAAAVVGYAVTHDLARYAPPFAIAALCFALLVARPRVPALLGAVLAFTFVAQLVLRPVIDRQKNMRPGVLELSASIPAGEELVGYDLDETTLAVVPFYSGRLLRELRQGGDPVRVPDPSRSCHLIVLEKRRAKLPPELASRYDYEHTVQLVEGRELAVYRMREER
ncbi:MAG: glycosyltransferase family 39 protein [Planctomycetes bacterium]|nr:glycosyltransferase family 39 protein [Planctomycetota bacterium]